MEMQNLRRLEPSAKIMLYELDPTRISPNASVIHFQDQSREPIVFQGVSYQKWPIEVTGFNKTAQGQLPRPRMRVSNVLANEMGELADAYDDLIGMRVTRIITYERYLDGHHDASPLAVVERDFYVVEKLVSRNLGLLEFELACSLDLQGVRIPRGVVSPVFCRWQYKSVECGWQGRAPFFDLYDRPTADPLQDNCSRRLQGCRNRFGKDAQGNDIPGATIPAGIFPGTELVKR